MWTDTWKDVQQHWLSGKFNQPTMWYCLTTVRMAIIKNSMWTENFQMFKLDLEKAEEPEIKLPTSRGSSKKRESSRKISTSTLSTTPKPLTMWITKNCGKFSKRGEYQTTWPASWEICMQVKKQQLELYMEQWTGSKSERSTSRLLYIVTLLF